MSAWLAGVTHGLHVWFPHELGPHQQRLMDALGVVVHVDPPETRQGNR